MLDNNNVMAILCRQQQKTYLLWAPLNSLIFLSNFRRVSISLTNFHSGTQYQIPRKIAQCAAHKIAFQFQSLFETCMFRQVLGELLLRRQLLLRRMMTVTVKAKDDSHVGCLSFLWDF